MNTQRRTALDDVFDVETRHITVIPAESNIVVPVTTEMDIDSDAKLVSDNIKELLKLGIDATMRAAEVAEESESPRAYEVLSNMLKTMGDMNAQLLDIHDKKKRIKGQIETQQSSTVNNTAVFVGTTANLLDLLEQKRKGNDNAS